MSHGGDVPLGGIFVPMQQRVMISAGDVANAAYVPQENALNPWNWSPEEIKTMTARPSLTIKKLPAGWARIAAPAVLAPPSADYKIDVAAWNWARRTPQHDWIAALHRPYVPPV